jgi:hypothetical protein
LDEGLSDLEEIARATGALAPAGGVDCDGDGTIDITPGQPLICSTGASGEGIAEAITALVEAGTKPPTYRIQLPIILKNSDGSSPPSGFNSQFNGSAPGWEVHSGTWTVDSNYYSTTGLAGTSSSASYAADFTNFVTTRGSGVADAIHAQIE